MGSMSVWHWIVVVGVAVVLFGHGRISAVMGDIAKGIKMLKSGVKEMDDEHSS
jgi:sec-independent protein translocase protein TatA